MAVRIKNNNIQILFTSNINNIPMGSLVKFVYGYKQHIGLRFENGIVSLTDPRHVWTPALLPTCEVLPDNTKIEYSKE